MKATAGYNASYSNTPSIASILQLALEWYAYVDESGYGIGLYTPGTGSAVYYTHGTGPGGADAGSCSYFAPIRRLHITAPFSFSYKAYLTIGNIDRIRDTFKAINILSSQDMARKDCQD